MYKIDWPKFSHCYWMCDILEQNNVHYHYLTNSKSAKLIFFLHFFFAKFKVYLEVHACINFLAVKHTGKNLSFNEKKILYTSSWFNWLFPQIIYCSWTGLSIQFKCLLTVLLTFCLKSTFSMETFLNLNKQYKLHLPQENYFELPFLKKKKWSHI